MKRTLHFFLSLCIYKEYTYKMADMMLSQYETMSIAASGNPCLETATKKSFQSRITNYIDDIDGSRNKNKYEKFYKDAIQYSTPEIEDHNPLRRESHRKTVRDALFIDDIDGTRRRVKDRMIETKRCTNPLEPVYKLPEVEIRIHTPPRFLRDSTRLDDIEGSSSAPLYNNRRTQRDPLKISDIEGSKYIPK